MSSPLATPGASFAATAAPAPANDLFGGGAKKSAAANLFGEDAAAPSPNTRALGSMAEGMDSAMLAPPASVAAPAEQSASERLGEVDRVRLLSNPQIEEAPAPAPAPAPRKNSRQGGGGIFDDDDDGAFMSTGRKSKSLAGLLGPDDEPPKPRQRSVTPTRTAPRAAERDLFGGSGTPRSNPLAANPLGDGPAPVFNPLDKRPSQPLVPDGSTTPRGSALGPLGPLGPLGAPAPAAAPAAAAAPAPPANPLDPLGGNPLAK